MSTDSSPTTHEIHSQARHSVIPGLAVRNKPIKKNNSGDNKKRSSLSNQNWIGLVKRASSEKFKFYGPMIFYLKSFRNEVGIPSSQGCFNWVGGNWPGKKWNRELRNRYSCFVTEMDCQEPASFCNKGLRENYEGWRHLEKEVLPAWILATFPGLATPCLLLSLSKLRTSRVCPLRVCPGDIQDPLKVNRFGNECVDKLMVWIHVHWSQQATVGKSACACQWAC